MPKREKHGGAAATTPEVAPVVEVADAPVTTSTADAPAAAVGEPVTAAPAVTTSTVGEPVVAETQPPAEPPSPGEMDQARAALIAATQRQSLVDSQIAAGKPARDRLDSARKQLQNETIQRDPNQARVAKLQQDINLAQAEVDLNQQQVDNIRSVVGPIPSRQAPSWYAGWPEHPLQSAIMPKEAIDIQRGLEVPQRPPYYPLGFEPDKPETIARSEFRAPHLPARARTAEALLSAKKRVDDKIRSINKEKALINQQIRTMKVDQPDKTKALLGSTTEFVAGLSPHPTAGWSRVMGYKKAARMREYLETERKIGELQDRLGRLEDEREQLTTIKTETLGFKTP